MIYVTSLYIYTLDFFPVSGRSSALGFPRLLSFRSASNRARSASNLRICLSTLRNQYSINNFSYMHTERLLNCEKNHCDNSVLTVQVNQVLNLTLRTMYLFFLKT